MKFHTCSVLLTNLTISMILAIGAFAQARDAQKASNQSKLEIQPLNVKPGLWETTATYKRSGASPIPSEALAKLNPEQRARLEQRINANSSGSTNTVTEPALCDKRGCRKG